MKKDLRQLRWQLHPRDTPLRSGQRLNAARHEEAQRRDEQDDNYYTIGRLRRRPTLRVGR